MPQRRTLAGVGDSDSSGVKADNGVRLASGVSGPPLLAVRQVSKVFRAVLANDRLELDVYAGRIHGLLGENGAGKSTVIKVLGGIYRPDSGQVLVAGEQVSIASPYAASALGIEIVHQESILIPTLSIAENIALRRQIRGRLPASLSRTFAETAAGLGFHLDPRAKAGDLSIGDRQRTDIVVALMGDARVLILDEPTPIMAPEERTSFFELLHRLKAQGKAVVIVTHRLQEAVEECDDITVLRGGRAVTTWTTKNFPTEPQILEAMIGTSDLARGNEAKRADRTWEEAPALAAVGVVAKCSERLTVRVDRLEVRPGEILGVAGIEGSGQRELATLLVGQTSPTKGTVELLGKLISDYPSRELCNVVGDVPDEPDLATAGELSIWQNLSMPSLLWQRVTWPRQRQELKSAAAEAISRFNVKAPNANVQVATLSGGNKRRVVLARETYLKSPAVIVLTYATRGLDAKAASGLLEHVQGLANDGTAVVFISSDLEELLTICDSVCPIVDGNVGVAVPSHNLTQTDLARMMLGLDQGIASGPRPPSEKEAV